MPSPPRASSSHLLFAAILVAVFVVQSLSASLQKSPVFDEPPHIAAGLAYVHAHVFHTNLQHPPLLKEIAAVSLSIAGIRWPQSPLVQAMLRDVTDHEQLGWPVGDNIIRSNGADRVLFWARLPFILLGALLGWLIYWWGRELIGSTAALAALFLYAFDPTFIAHSGLVTTDVGVATFAILFLFALWRLIQRPDAKHALLCGLALGAALDAKFSAVLLLPVTALLLAGAILWPLSPDNVESALGKRPWMRFASLFILMCLIAALFVEASYFFPHDPLLYLDGLKKVNADHTPGYQAYLHGTLAPHFFSAFGVAYLLKEPLATVLLSIAGLLLLLRSKTMPDLSKLFLFLPPFVFFVVISVKADNLGIRYLTPALPFACLLAGLALQELFRKTAWGRYLAAALCLWIVVEAMAIYPDHLSYFNESACLLESPGKIGLDGGSRCGPLWLEDSNVDWGQGLKQLRAWQTAYAPQRPLHLAYFGAYPPEAYGLQFEKIDDSVLLLPQPPPGLYAVSANWVARGPALGARIATGDAAWLRTPPSAIVGHAFYIFDVR